MKRLNKKGFTLIELLAVIIILGILMIIAIPSVTSYIQNSRKSAYSDTAVQYADAVIKEVNGGKNFRLYSTTTLYMIPVGHEKDKSCVTLESGGQSPFSDQWNYAYIGVTYDGKGYNYYFIGEDMAGQGISFIDKKTLTDDGTDYIYSSYAQSLGKTEAGKENITSAFATKMHQLYESKVNVSKCKSGSTGCTSANAISTEEETVLVNYIAGSSGKEPTKTINHIVYIAGVQGSDPAKKRCTLTEQVTANS